MKILQFLEVLSSLEVVAPTSTIMPTTPDAPKRFSPFHQSAGRLDRDPRGRLMGIVSLNVDKPKDSNERYFGTMDVHFAPEVARQIEAGVSGLLKARPWLSVQDMCFDCEMTVQKTAVGPRLFVSSQNIRNIHANLLIEPQRCAERIEMDVFEAECNDSYFTAQAILSPGIAIFRNMKEEYREIYQPGGTLLGSSFLNPTDFFESFLTALSVGSKQVTSTNKRGRERHYQLFPKLTRNTFPAVVTVVHQMATIIADISGAQPPAFEWDGRWRGFLGDLYRSITTTVTTVEEQFVIPAIPDDYEFAIPSFD